MLSLISGLYIYKYLHSIYTVSTGTCSFTTNTTAGSQAQSLSVMLQETLVIEKLKSVIRKQELLTNCCVQRRFLILHLGK